MESISNGVEDYLIDGLSFKLPPGSSYITDRRKSTFWASGSNSYKAEGGTKVVRFLLNGEDGTWLDPQTIRVQFDLKNNEESGEKRVSKTFRLASSVFSQSSRYGKWHGS